MPPLLIVRVIIIILWVCNFDIAYLDYLIINKERVFVVICVTISALEFPLDKNKIMMDMYIILKKIHLSC